MSEHQFEKEMSALPPQDMRTCGGKTPTGLQESMLTAC